MNISQSEKRDPLADAHVLLIAHGSRRDSANADLVQLAAMLRERGLFAGVQHAYLELADPSILAGAQLCIEAGARRVVMLPYFLSAGRHAARDLLEFRDRLNQEHAGVTFSLAPPLGLHPALIEILLDRVQEICEEPATDA